ncbi:transporter substrate-binding domain-containing protein [uncultured Ilyobacter sp.]|uniref:transporter substrate-binding domain-containing protein n=1 Tax=uncultured Ilyobacter sp. TaxID=544433 RepID=UPI0029C98952|nr:transporter substrate-binding domain-containing protein [uncultured Ilyobacter sp.]
MKKVLMILVIMMLSAASYAEGRVEKIIKNNKIRVGTTGDYKPFTYYNGKDFEGYDIEVAKYIAEDLGVELEFVPTTWKTLIDDLESDKFDIAMGGITRNTKRKIRVELSRPYLVFGKSPIVRKADEGKYTSLEAIDKPGVKVGVNIGGTNEKFADKNIKSAQIIKYERNLDVPQAVIKGEVDVMISESPEAIHYANEYKKLAAPMIDNPMTKSQLGYLIPKGEYDMLDLINFILDEMELKGIMDELKAKQIK